MDTATNDIPRAPLPPQIADAICGTQGAAEPPEIDFNSWNPWMTHKVGGAVRFSDEDSEERELRDALTPIEKLFAGSAVTSTAPPATARLNKSDDWDEPLIKYPTKIPRRHAATAEINLLPEASEAEHDEAVNRCLPAPEGESIGDFFARVDRILVEMGRRPALSVI
jgi:hypothetical protein